MRYPEIDIIKGIAIILMVLFHYFYVAYLLGKPVVNIHSKYVSLMATIAHNIFIFMVGVNLVVSYNRTNNATETGRNAYIGKQFKRALLLFILGMVMTFITSILFPDKYIRFGIFHFISLAIMVSLLFIDNIQYTGFGIMIFGLLNYIITNYKSSFYNICNNNKLTCFILGIYNNYSSIDHFSFIPFFLTVLMGMGIGQVFYKGGMRPANTILDRVYKNSNAMKSLGYLGKQSLNIYLFHWVIVYYLLA
jgi:uncharacterized membrane protein